jgi:hypothetical protein
MLACDREVPPMHFKLLLAAGALAFAASAHGRSRSSSAISSARRASSSTTSPSRSRKSWKRKAAEAQRWRSTTPPRRSESPPSRRARWCRARRRARAVLWALYKEGTVASEYRDYKVLALFVHNPGLIDTASKRVVKLSDLKGLRLRSPNRTVSAALEHVGAVPVMDAVKAHRHAVLHFGVLHRHEPRAIRSFARRDEKGRGFDLVRGVAGEVRPALGLV